MSGMMTILKNVRRYKRMKRKELEKLPVLRATTAMLEQAEKEPMVQTGYFRKELRYEHEYYARCKRFDRILKVAIYLTKIWLPAAESQCMSCFLTMMRRIS